MVTNTRSDVLEQITPDTAAQLAHQAGAQGMDVNTYLQMLLGIPQHSQSLAALSDQAFEALMQELAEGTAGRPLLPADFARTDLCADHD